MIKRGNWSNAGYFREGIDRLEEKYGYLPEEITTDGGFTSGDNYDYVNFKGGTNNRGRSRLTCPL